MPQEGCFALAMVHPNDPNAYMVIAYGYLVKEEKDEETGDISFNWMSFRIQLKQDPNGNPVPILEWPPPVFPWKLKESQFTGEEPFRMEKLGPPGSSFRLIWIHPILDNEQAPQESVSHIDQPRIIIPTPNMGGVVRDVKREFDRNISLVKR